MRYIWEIFLAALLVLFIIGCGTTARDADATPVPAGSFHPIGSPVTGIAPNASSPTGPTATKQPQSGTATLTPVKAGGALWRPALRTSWQWQLDDKPLDPALTVQVYDIDGFSRDAATVTALHQHGAKVICYIDVGSWEDYRADASKFPAAVLGNVLDGWPNERWLDIRRLDILAPLITARMDMCKTKGFDAIEPDNIDGYTNNTGFPLTAQDQLTFNTFLANQAHAQGLSIGLKNDLDQVARLVPLYDWALNEQCFEYQECDKLQPFIAANKAVFNVEYTLDTSQFCPQANTLNFNSMKKHLSLDAWRQPCR